MAATCSRTTRQRLGTQCVEYCASCGAGSVLTEAVYSLAACSNTLPVQYCKSSGSSGTTCSATTYSSSTCGSTPANTLSNCSSVTKKCFGGKYVQTCDTCQTGYNSVTRLVDISGCSNSYSYNDCIPKPVSGCTTDDDCTDLNEDWADVPDQNFQGKKTGKCVTSGVLNKCEAEISFRCKAGFYGSGQNCTACPLVGGDYTLVSGSVSSLAGSTVITMCQIKAGARIKDTTGTFSSSAACRYRQ